MRGVGRSWLAAVMMLERRRLSASARAPAIEGSVVSSAAGRRGLGLS
jgi:hypothetical protein